MMKSRVFRKAGLLLAAVPCAAFLLTACSGQAEETGAELAEEEARNDPEDGEYIFQDVEGNEYEAPLLSDVPKCTYDLSKIKTDEETGVKSFHDEENGVTARFGIDVSEFQGEEIDWTQVKESGVEFVIIRLGYRAYGDTGDLVMDAMYEQNMKGALEAGLDVGVYFFSQAVSAAEEAGEAGFGLKNIKPYEISGQGVWDTEAIQWDTARTDRKTENDFTHFYTVYCETGVQHGYDAVISCT